MSNKPLDIGKFNQIDWQAKFIEHCLEGPLQSHLPALLSALSSAGHHSSPKDVKRWQNQLKQLPKIHDACATFGSTVTLSSAVQLMDDELKKTEAVLRNFMPWRKGPFKFFDIEIDTEWRSDWKWDRVLPHIGDLCNQRVLDVGCGSGYHLFRMHEHGAKQVIGVDPTQLFFYQFQCFKQYLPTLNIHFLPIGIEHLPPTQAFDTVFSMGVFYHRPDPISFLKELKNQLTNKGQLILETLIVDGDENTMLVPTERYAQMRNVWFLPSVKALTIMLQRVGFKQVVCVDEDQTSTTEQRTTPWMTNHSLIDFLDPDDHSKTVEGYPAPKRAVFVAKMHN